MICFLDMDGVLCDLHDSLLKHHNISDPYYNPDNLGKYGLTRVMNMHYLEIFKGLHRSFWANLKPTPWMKELVQFCEENFECFILTAPSNNNECLAGKREWIGKHMPKFASRFLIGAPKYACAGPNKVLVDDKESNIDRFIEYGGHGVLVPQPWNKLYMAQTYPLVQQCLKDILLFEELNVRPIASA